MANLLREEEDLRLRARLGPQRLHAAGAYQRRDGGAGVGQVAERERFRGARLHAGGPLALGDAVQAEGALVDVTVSVDVARTVRARCDARLAPRALLLRHLDRAALRVVGGS